MKTILCAIGKRAVSDRCIRVAGKSVDNACVYDKQAMVLVNCGGTAQPTTGDEVMTLARAIHTSVFERLGLRLEREPVVV